MACHKILIDYAEYVRLKSFEAKYEQEQHKRKLSASESQKGSGGWLTYNSTETPLMSTGPSITTPANAIVDDRDENTEQTGHSGLSVDAERKWYFLGPPHQA